MDGIQKIKKLVSALNEHRDSYYNKQSPTISDFEYDQMFDELKDLEETTGIVLSNSPTVTVGYEVKSELAKTKHSHPMLSLDKTKSVSDLKKFAGDQQCILSLKMDGLTVLLTYSDGQLIQAETRGNGEEGEIITHNARVFDNIPLNINYKGRLEIEGEAIITYDDFDKINNAIDNPNDKYKNPRNLASGSVRQLDSNVASKRHIKFIAWKVPTTIEGFDENDSFIHKLIFIKNLGFDVVPLLTYSKDADGEYIKEMTESLKNAAERMGYPIDGLVMTYNGISYGESLGSTGHHPKHSIAFKFYDEEVETVLKNVEWTMGKSGVLTPTAVFYPVEISGSTIEKASLHNISVMVDVLGVTPYVGQKITVYKANDVIPQVLEADRKMIDAYDVVIDIPQTCPICGEYTEIREDHDTKVLVCTNDNCSGKLLGKLTHFVSKNAMNIDGLSEATISKFIELGWLNSFFDIYTLENHSEEMAKLKGFGKKSVDKLMKSIEKSRNTTLDRFIYSLCIPLIGKSASKTISKHCNGSYNTFYQLFEQNFDWSNLEDFGFAMAMSLDDYVEEWRRDIKVLAELMNFEAHQIVDNTSNSLSGMTFVITGSLNHFVNRDEAKERIEAFGGKVSGSVSAKTSYLVNNDIESSSGKNKKAKELGVKIITEEELVNMMK